MRTPADAMWFAVSMFPPDSRGPLSPVRTNFPPPYWHGWCYVPDCACSDCGYAQRYPVPPTPVRYRWGSVADLHRVVEENPSIPRPRNPQHRLLRQQSMTAERSPATLHHKETSKYHRGTLTSHVSSSGKPPAGSRNTRNSVTTSEKSVTSLPNIGAMKFLSLSRHNLNHDNVRDSSSGVGYSASFPSLNNNYGNHNSNNNNGRAYSDGSGTNSPLQQRGQVVSSKTSSFRQDPYGRRLPLTPSEALKYYSSSLTDYEKKEIEQYPEVWYLGLDAQKIEGEEGGAQNGGYDDENGSYNKVLHDHISYRYEILEVIGKGSFGQVIRALDHKTNEQVAIKIIRNKKRFHHQALIEVKILDHLRKRDKEAYHNIIQMLDYFYFRNHLCISFELMG